MTETYLSLSYSPSTNWRESKTADKGWPAKRQAILKRDEYTCAYCGYKSLKYQVVHHIDHSPDNDDENNLQTVCQMCNLILHAGQGCALLGVVDLYEYSNYSQIDIIRITREIRASGKKDKEIVEFLGLRHKFRGSGGYSAFGTVKDYLGSIFGFVSSRKPKKGGMYANWLAHLKGKNRRKQFRESRVINKKNTRTVNCMGDNSDFSKMLEELIDNER